MNTIQSLPRKGSLSSLRAARVEEKKHILLFGGSISPSPSRCGFERRYRHHNAEDQKILRKSIAAEPSNGLMLAAFAGRPKSTHSLSFAPTPRLPKQSPVLPTKTQRIAKVRIGEPWGVDVETDPIRGAVVTRVEPNSVAAREQIQVGAAFIAINGNATPTMSKTEVIDMMRRHSALDLTFQITPDMVSPARSPLVCSSCSGNER